MKTSKHSTRQLTLEESILLQEGFPVSHLAQQDREKGQPTIDISGPKCFALFEKLAPSGSWQKTFAASLVGMKGWFSTRCALTWRVKVTKSSRSYFLLQASTRRTAGTESGLWLGTPRANEQARSKKFSKGRTPTPSEFAQALLLTPTTREEPVDLDKFKARMEKYPNGTTMPNLATQVQQMLPTPTANSWKDGTEKERPANQPTRRSELNHLMAQENGKPSRLSPLFVEEMMGFPRGWTASPFQSGDESP